MLDKMVEDFVDDFDADCERPMLERLAKLAFVGFIGFIASVGAETLWDTVRDHRQAEPDSE